VANQNKPKSPSSAPARPPGSGAAAAAGHHGEHGSHGVGRYILIWAILLMFTAITVTTGRMDLGGANIYVAMAIASTKATLVLLFFMHLYEEGAVNRLILISSILFALLLMVGTFGDLLTRAPGALPNGGPLPIKPHGAQHGEAPHAGGESEAH
jgi:caa(3)-type oxidase subunit IV